MTCGNTRNIAELFRIYEIVDVIKYPETKPSAILAKMDVNQTGRSYSMVAGIFLGTRTTIGPQVWNFTFLERALTNAVKGS